MLGKKSSENSAKKRFLYSHNYCDHNMGGKNAANNFSETQELCDQKMLGKKSTGKSAKKGFFIRTNIVPKKWWERNARNNFS